MSTQVTSELGAFVRSASGRTVRSSTPHEFWLGLSGLVVSKIADDWDATTEAYQQSRQEHYFSAEFLEGRALLNNLVNLGMLDEAREAVAAYGLDISDVLDAEQDAALGNGGLGRLAACFLDSCATLDLPVTGYGILYRYGLFRQTIDDGFQNEHPDDWMEEGYPFVIRREEQEKHVHFADMEVRAIPYDMPIVGYDTKNVNTLRLWKSEPMHAFDYDAFNSQRFTDAIVERERVADLCRVLYPNDTTYDGKVLRVRQQYFFVSASLQTILENYKRVHGNDLSKFAKYNSIQLNDTHPVLAIPELMRLLMDKEGLGWDAAWKIVSKTFGYTNHTVLAEALETWEISIFQKLFPRILEIVNEIDRRFRAELKKLGVDQATIDYMSPVHGGRVHMAWIACYASYSINGVAALHTEILKRDTLKDWYALWPKRFNNKTNGVTQRRWLNNCNPELSALLTRELGSDSWVTDLEELKTLLPKVKDKALMKEVMAIKRNNKVRFAKWLEKRQGDVIPIDAIYDTQIKRLHEYKRQLLNAMYILDLYYRLKDDPKLDIEPRVFIFGAKAAPGYKRAKAIIKLINEIGRIVNGDPDVNEKIRVVFIENYNVTPAEYVIPATDVSEQISTAGKEASGTGNMKFMMNGALTLGTLDGANVEILDAVGDKNAYIFGAKEEELPVLRETYNPRDLYMSVPGLRRVLDSFTDGTLNDGGTGDFHDLKVSLLDGSSWEDADVYYLLGDFASYRETRDKMAEDYRDTLEWARMCWVNICESGRFSSDRTIRDYAEEVWKIKPTAI